MKSSRAILLAAFAIIAASHAASAQAPPQCNAFIPLRDDAQQKAAAVRTATEHKAERKEVCALVTRFATAEAAVVKFLEANKTWCGIPDEAVKAAKTGHERTTEVSHRGLQRSSRSPAEGADAQRCHRHAFRRTRRRIPKRAAAPSTR